MTNQVRAPWTMEQVAALWRFQMSGVFHPFTCGQRDDHPVIDGEKGLLIPTRNGWICPCCDYTQDWAHDFMFENHDIDPTDAALKAIRGGGT